MELNNLDKPLPSSLEAEKVILGAILLDNTLMLQAVELITEREFYSPLHRRVFNAMTRLFERGSVIDPILIGEELKKDDQLDNIGGIATITNLTFGLPHFSDIETYAKVVKDKSRTRDIITACREITTEALSELESADALSEFAETKIFDICQTETLSEPESVFTLAESSYNLTIDRIEKGIRITGVPSSFIDVDRKLGGWKKGDLVIVAARPSMGKSALALQFAFSPAKHYVTAFFSLEMPKEQLVARILCSEARVNLSAYINGFLTSEEKARLSREVFAFHQRNLQIDDTAAITVNQLRAKARRIKQQHKRLDLIVIDYLQLMNGGSRRNENRQQEVSGISRDLKALAKELQVPIIALSQLSRSPEVRNPPRPMLSDLRESGAIEQDADVVCFIYRDEYYQPTDDNAGVAEIIVSKNRNGPTGTSKLAFLKEFTRFEDYYESQGN